MAFTGNAAMLWLDASLGVTASATAYEPVVLVAYAETTGPETGVTVTITTSPEGFTPTDWTYAPYALGTYAPHPVPIAPQTLSLGNTAPIPNFGTPGVYLLIYGYFTSTGSKTFAATVDTAQSTAISASASITITDAPQRAVTVDLYSAANPPVLLHSGMPVTPGGFWTDEDSDAGAAEVTVPELWSGITDAVEGRLLRFRVNGTADRTAVVERIRVVPKASDPAQRMRVLTGRDWLAEFDDALVNPPLGLENRPQVQSVRFDWTHPGLAIPTAPTVPPGVRWIRPYSMGALYKGNVDALGTPVQPFRIGKLGQAPRGWPDSFTGWIWERPYNGNYAHPVMTAYFDFALYFDPAPPSNLIGVDRAVANRPFVMVFTGDDTAQLAFDGVIVDSGVEPPAIQWQRCTRVVIPDVSPGWHTIRIKAQNRPYTQYGGQYNMGAVAFCAFQPLQDLRASGDPYGQARQDTFDPPVNLVVRTAGQVVNGQITGLNISQGGGWWTIGGEHLNGDPDAAFMPGFQEPGFTVGKAFRLLFESAQGEGHLPGWTLGFNDLYDSAGSPWPVSNELTARVSDTLLAVMRSWHDEGFWDVAARASSRVLDAWVWQERGNFHLGGTPLTWNETHLSSITIEGER